MRTNTTKAKLKAGETVFGCFVRYPDASLVEVQGYFGWDFLIFDAEHGTLAKPFKGIYPWWSPTD